MSEAGSGEGFGKKSDEEAAGQTLEIAKPTVAPAEEQSAPAASETPPAESETPPVETVAAKDDTAPATSKVDAEVRMSDGGIYLGTIELKKGESVIDIVNSSVPFFRLVENSGKVRLIGKAQVMQIIPYEAGTAAGRGGGSLM